MATLNGDFESDASGWAGSGGGAIARQTTTAHTGTASANVTSGAVDLTGARATMTGDAAQSSTWDLSAYLQAHAGGDVGRGACVAITTIGGVAETFRSSAITLALGPGSWQLATATATFVNASHTDALLNVAQNGAGAACNIDVDTVQYARHLTYLPSGVPLVTELWVPGKPAGNYSEPIDATTTVLIASGIYAGA